MLPFFDGVSMRSDAWPALLLLPLAGAVLGVLGNWLFLRLLFGPLPAGRPALLVRQADALGRRLADTLAAALPLSELFRLMEPERIAHHVTRAVTARLDEHVDDVMRERHAVLWDNLPQAARQRVYARVQRQLPSLFDNLIEDMAEHVDELVDLRQLLESLVSEHRERLAALLAAALRQEQGFLRRAGLCAGLGLGLLQALLWLLHPSYWLLFLPPPLVAAASVQLPLALLFWQGGRGEGRSVRSELQPVLAHGLASELLTPRRLLHLMLTGARAGRTRAMIRRHMRPMLETGLVRTTLQLLLGAGGYAHIKQRVTEKVTRLTVAELADTGLAQREGNAVAQACARHLAAADTRPLVRAVLEEGRWPRLAAVLLVGLLAGGLQVLVAHLAAGG